jgi:predicted transposase/invertase (TIGR01784 family)
MKTDSLFYRLFKNHPNLALYFLGLDYKASSYRFSSEEIKQTAFRLDGLFTPLVDNPKQPLIFAEVQYQPDNDFYDRLFTEISLYLRLNKPQHEWLALVIYPTRTVERPANIAFLPFMRLPQLHIIYLEDYQHKAGSLLALDLARLLSCEIQQTVSIAYHLLNSYDNLKADVLDLIETILVYKLPRLSRKEIRKMFALNEVDLTKSLYYQEVMEETIENLSQDDLKSKNPLFYQQIMEETIEKLSLDDLKSKKPLVYQEMLDEGIDKGQHIMLQRLLTHRFGKLPQSIEQRLAQASRVQIQAWAERLLDAPDLATIFKN